MMIQLPPSVEELLEKYDELRTIHGWNMTVIHEQVVQDGAGKKFPIRCYSTTHQKEERAAPAIWLLAGIHGEEPAGPIAISKSIRTIAELGKETPIVLIPLCNPSGISRGWRYPDSQTTGPSANSPLGHSVGDSSWLLPLVTASSAADNDNLKLGMQAQARDGDPILPETKALTSFVVEMQKRYPVKFSIDFHEDCLIDSGTLDKSYIYSSCGAEGKLGRSVARKLVEILSDCGIPPINEGITKFGEPIHQGVIGFSSDCSIDELLGAKFIIDNKTGRIAQGPSAKLTIVVETPGGVDISKRVNAQCQIINSLSLLNRLFDQSI